MVTASICTIGDEILIGQIIDTNSSKIATALNSIGVKVNCMISTGDNEQDIISTINNCLKETNIVIITGGLGPTKDDITKKVLGKITGAKAYIKNDRQLNIIKTILTTRGIEMSDINLAQASVPDSCKIIINECGTAPCMEFEIAKEKYGHKGLIFSLPGVPFEAEAAIPKVLDSIKGHFSLENIFHKTVCTFGIAESTLAKQIEQWEDNLPKNLHLAYLPNPILGVRLRLSIYGVGKEEGERDLNNNTTKLKTILGNVVYGEDNDSLQSVIGDMLIKRGEKISVAESCTGGFLASLFTSIPGSSEYFYGGIVSYDNSVKINTLGVKRETIEKYGAVSSECVIEMANGVKKLMGTDYAIATSGIAGPGGGTQQKPVGTIWIAIAGKNNTKTFQMIFKGSRNLNIERFASNALNFLRLEIQNKI
ncbi:MAG: CinA family nicotinamide mononucleotide deamidase-related protein [Bacteroidales bacterium]